MKKIIFFIAVLSAMTIQAQDLTVKQVQFETIQNAPTFPGCEVSDKDCFHKMITDEVSKNFNSNLVSGLMGKQKVIVQFVIDVDGSISNIKATGAHKALEAEAVRVVSNLPQMTAGKMNGEKVAVSYTLPIVYVAKDKKSIPTIGQPVQKQNN